MKTFYLMFALIVILFVPKVAIPQNEQGSTKDELLKLENEWNAAYNRQDKVAVDRILRDDYLFIDADAYVLKKRDYLDTISKVKVKSEDLKYTDVRVYGDTAIVHSIWSGTYSFEGKETTETIRYTDVFVREKGKWLAVSSQGTRVPKQ
jgi:uncharacterized protein (TIGR02246 family)